MTKNDVNKKDFDQQSKPISTKKPNELGAIHVEAFIKIHDPNTKEVYVESRA